jgi:hypothetical protein
VDTLDSVLLKEIPLACWLMNSEEAEGKEETNAEISLAKGTRWS